MTRYWNFWHFCQYWNPRCLREREKSTSEGACQNANNDLFGYLVLLLRFLSSADQQSRKQEHILGVLSLKAQVPMKRKYWLYWSYSSCQNIVPLIRLSISVLLCFNKSKLKPGLTEAKATQFHCMDERQVRCQCEINAKCISSNTNTNYIRSWHILWNKDS